MEFFKLPRKLRFSVHFACITDLGIQTCALWQAKLVSITKEPGERPVSLSGSLTFLGVEGVPIHFVGVSG